MSCSPALSTPAKSQKPSFINGTESLSLVNLNGEQEDHEVNPDMPSNSESEKRGECLIAKSASTLKNRNPSAMECGVITKVKSILRKESESQETSSSARKSIVWGDKTTLETRFFYPREENDNVIAIDPVRDEKSNCPRIKKNGVMKGIDEVTPMGMNKRCRSDKLDIELDGAPIVEYPKGTFDDDDFPMDVGNGDGDVDLQSLETTIADTPMTDDKDDDNIIPPTEMEKTPKKAPKRKYQRKKKPVIEEPAMIEEDMVLVMNDGDSDNENMLMIDEGDENTEEDGTKKGKKRKSMLELRREKEEAILENDKMLAQLNEKTDKTEQDMNDEFEVLAKMVSQASKRKGRKTKVKSDEELRKEVEKELEVDDPELVKSNIMKKEKEVYDEWKRSFLAISPKEDPMIKELEAEADAYAEKKKKERRGELDDMPDFDDLVMQYNKFKMNPLDINDDEQDEICVEPKEKVTKKKVVEKKEVKKKSEVKGGSNKKKKDDKEHSDVPQTEEDKEKKVLAEIEKKKADATEKATRMKQQKIENKERKRIEWENKKEEEEKVREAKKLKKNHERNIMGRKPKSRAEAARRTKALLAMEKGTEKSAAEEDEEDEPKRKKRKYRKRTKPVSFIRRIRDADDVESEIGCGKYIENPCDMCDEDEWTNLPYEDEDSDDDQDIDEVLSVPFIWTSEEDKLLEGDIGPLNFDPDEQMKRHVNETEKFSNGLNVEYHEMVKHLDGMKLNLFADTTLRRFDHRVVHNIDSLATMRTWPIDLIPHPAVSIPIHQNRLWIKHFEGLVRVRPLHKKKDQMTSKTIDEMSGGNIETVTKNDIVTNLEELILSKLKKTSWTPLPSARNPFDIPEISTRNESRAVVDYHSVPYVHKLNVQSLPCEYNNKKRKKTRKEVLQEIATKPRPDMLKREDIYIQEEEGDEEDKYKFAWNEMGEMIENPMRDNRMEEDPFAAANPYEGMEYDDEEVASGGNGMMEESHYHHEKEDETQLGEAFSFMAAHIDV